MADLETIRRRQRRANKTTRHRPIVAYFTEDEIAQVKEVAQRAGLSQSGWVRELIADTLDFTEQDRECGT